MSLLEETPRGRPRDPRIDDLVVDATRELLAEVGFAETTIQAISRRAGVGASAIYRRWPTRIELIEHAIFPEFAVLAIERSGDLRTDLQRYVTAYSNVFASAAARVALPALLSTYQAQPQRHNTVSLRVGVAVRESFREMVRAAPPGAVDPTVDPDAILDLLIGAVLYRSFIHPFTGRREGDDCTTDLLLRALRPPTP